MSIVNRPAAMGLFAALAFGLSAPAFADTDLVVDYHPESGSITRTKQVDISDLHLSTARDRARLEQRITLAAKKVCDYNGGYGLRQPADYTRCFTKAKADALGSAPAIQTASLER